MWYKLGMSIKKELLLLKRDFGGLIILFVMPVILVVTVTLIQNSSYQAISDRKLPIILVDNDGGSIADTIKKQINASGTFEWIDQIDGQAITEETAKKAVNKGTYQMALVLPAQLSADLKVKIDQNVEKILEEFSMATANVDIDRIVTDKEIHLYFDPATQNSFKEGIKNAIDRMIAQTENQLIYAAFQQSLGEGTAPLVGSVKDFIQFKEMSPLLEQQPIKPNSVQHNVPAWSLFAIFFIMVPLSINMVKEKTLGTQVRLLCNPTPTYVLLAGKTITYLLICLLQFYLIVLVGRFVFPQLGLPQFEVQGYFILLSIMTLFAGLAAIGLGIILGTLAKTQEQSSPFGATFVVILAAVGGVWIPVFAMPELMQYVSKLSPMNWALSGYYDIVLRNGSLLDIAPEIALLFLFFVFMVIIAILYDKRKRAV
ncbi:ABC transporter permease [Flavobacterium sp. JP2137]|uniref:ABC transporter permease n=1 Tax=Flavobacterium sp. JP2137 TaxID=3414510 RepID=UPI003D2FF9E9